MKKLPPVHPPSFGSDDFQEPRALKKKNEATSMESVKVTMIFSISKVISITHLSDGFFCDTFHGYCFLIETCPYCAVQNQDCTE